MAVSLEKKAKMIEYTPIHIKDEYVPTRDTSPQNPTLNISVVSSSADKRQLAVCNESEDKAENENKKIRWYETDVFDMILKGFLAIIGIAFVFSLLWGIGGQIGELFNVTETYTEQQKAINAVTEGVVVGKQIENAKSNALRTTETEYRIYIDAEYELNGENLSGEKYFCVPFEVYQMYNIGDQFDASNLKSE